MSSRGDVQMSMFPLRRASFHSMLAAFAARYPEVRLFVDLSIAAVDLRRDGYDLALRAGPNLDFEPGLVAQTLVSSRTLARAQTSGRRAFAGPRRFTTPESDATRPIHRRHHAGEQDLSTWRPQFTNPRRRSAGLRWRVDCTRAPPMRVLVSLVFVVAGCGATLRGADLVGLQGGAARVPIGPTDVVQMIGRDGRKSPWLRASAIYTDARSICVDAAIEPRAFLVAVAIAGLDPRAAQTLAGDDVKVTHDRDGDWVVTAPPDKLLAWFQRHSRAISMLHRQFMTLAEPRYYVELQGAARSGPSDRLDLLARLSTPGTRVGWRWSDIGEVSVDRAYHESIANRRSLGDWLAEPPPSGFVGFLSGQREIYWRPSACPSGEHGGKLFEAR